MEAINENESLYDLVQKRKQIRAKATIAQISGKVDAMETLTAEYREITKKISALENAAKTEGACIRIM